MLTKNKDQIVRVEKYDLLQETRRSPDLSAIIDANDRAVREITPCINWLGKEEITLRATKVKTHKLSSDLRGTSGIVRSVDGNANAAPVTLFLSRNDVRLWKNVL